MRVEAAVAPSLTVLVIDPDRHALDQASAALRFGGYDVLAIALAAGARSLLRLQPVAAIVVDPRPTVFDGVSLDVVAALRAQTDVPIIVVSSSPDEPDKVAMLDAGADDYLSKPYGVEELLARLRAVFRRAAPTPPDEQPLTTPDFTVDLAGRRWLRADGTEAHLTPIEWQVVEVLVHRAGHLVSQSELLSKVWGAEAVGRSAHLRVHLTALRHKTEPVPASPRYFITVPRLGFRFDPAPSGRAADVVGDDRAKISG